MVSALSTARFIAFAGVILCAAVSVALAAHLTSTTETYLSGYYVFAALTIASAALALLTLPVMMLLDNIRKGAATSYIAVEVGWLAFLGVLFLASAGKTSNDSRGLPSNCKYPKIYPSVVVTSCNEIKAIQAFTYLAWLLCWGYAGTLFASAAALANRGYSAVWTQSVQHTDFNAPAQNTAAVPQAAFAPQLQPQVQPTQQLYPQGVTPQLVSQPVSYAGSPAVSPAFGQPIQHQQPQALQA